MTVMSCKWHSPPSAQTGQSWGWLSIRDSTTAVRNLAALSPDRENTAPSVTGVMQPITMRPWVSSSLGVLDHRALPTGAHGTHRRVPAEVGQVQPQFQAALQQVLAGRHLVFHAVDSDVGHHSPPWL